MKNLTNLPCLAVGVALACAAASVQGATITQTQSYGPSTVPFSTTKLFNLFDSNLGTLTSVEVILNTTATAEVDIFNITGIPQAFTGATATVPVTATGPGGASASTAPTAGPFSGTANPGLNSFPGLTASAMGTSFPSVAPYEAPSGGINLVTLTVAGVNGNYSGSAAPGVFFGGSATASGTVQLIYTYTSTVPDGGVTLALLGSALTGLAFARRKSA